MFPVTGGSSIHDEGTSCHHSYKHRGWDWDSYNWMMVNIDDDQMLPFIQNLLHPTPTTQGVMVMMRAQDTATIHTNTGPGLGLL